MTRAGLNRPITLAAAFTLTIALFGAASAGAEPRPAGTGTVYAYVYADHAMTQGVPFVEVWVFDGSTQWYQCTDANGKATFEDVTAGVDLRSATQGAGNRSGPELPCENADFRTQVGGGSKMYWMAWYNDSLGPGVGFEDWDKFQVVAGATTSINYVPVIPDQSLVCYGRPLGTWSSGWPNQVILGTPGDDTINGGAGNDIICGDGGDDTLIGGPGDDYLIGDAGNDVLDGRDDGDWLIGGDGNDIMRGKEGFDLLQGQGGKDKLNGGSHDDWLIGGTGKDQANYSALPADPKAWIQGDLGTGVFLHSGGSTDTLNGIEDVMGTTGKDWIIGDDKTNFLKGLGEADILEGRGGNDNLVGQAGNDTIKGDGGNDKLTGKAGIDTLEGGDGNDTLEGNLGNDTMDGGPGTDHLVGGAGTDTCTTWETQKGCEVKML